MTGIVFGLALIVIAGLWLAALGWLSSHDKGPNPRETFDPSIRQRIDALRDAEGEAYERGQL